MSVPQDDRPYVDVICDAASHDRPVSLDRFVFDGDRGWRWVQDRNRGTTPEEAAGGLPRMFLPIKRDTIAQGVDGGRKIRLACPKCGLDLPIGWERWTAMLDALRHAGKHDVHLPALVAIVTK